MKVIVFVLIIQLISAQNDYNFWLKNSLLCKPWNCISDQLGISNSTLPEKGEFLGKLELLLPEDWQPVAKGVVSVCYGVRPRVYTNTCPGQALLHCVVDNLMSQCPAKYHRKNDACAPLISLAGFKYMFSQSRYENLETNLPEDRRPPWFLKNYFSTKCCDIPEFLSKTELSECGFNDIVHIYSHLMRPKHGHLPQPVKKTQQLQEVHKHFSSPKEDPLDCCDIEDFLPQSARTKCLFETYWDGDKRLTIRNKNPGFLTPTYKPYSGFRKMEPQKFDVKIVPLSCETETCIFKKLNILKEDNTVDVASFTKLLDSFTANHPEWGSAKARVVTTCLARKRQGYDEECDINTLLACTFDVLTENCPRTSQPVSDPCRHSHTAANGTVCQISTSKYRPNRRQFCELPELVSKDILNKCGVQTIAKKENVPILNTASVWRQNLYRKFMWFSMPLPCQDSFPSTSCAMTELGVLNKYNFMDYFKMKERIRAFSSKNPEWQAFKDVILGLYSVTPLYKEHCTTQRKMLNVIDGLLMTCPVSKRKDTPMCNKMFTEIMRNTSLTPDYTTPKYYHHHNQIPADKKTEPKKHSHVKKLPPITALFDSGKEPTVEIISIKPQILHEERRPLVVLPVYKKEQPRIVEPQPSPLSTHLEPRLGPMKPGFGSFSPYKSYDHLERPIASQKPSFSPYSDPFLRSVDPAGPLLEDDDNRID